MLVLFYPIAENMNLIAENQGLRINQIMLQAENITTYISSYIQCKAKK